MTPPAKKATPSLVDRLKEKEVVTEKNDSPSVDDNGAAVVGEHAQVETPGSEVVNDGDPVETNVDSFQDPNPGPGLINKTPAELAAETPGETQKRYGISDEIPDDVHNNPNVMANRDMGFAQMPGGTHLHPDIAKDNYNRGVGGRPEQGGVETVVRSNVYATEAEVDDKGRAIPFAEAMGKDYNEEEMQRNDESKFAEVNNADDKFSKR